MNGTTREVAEAMTRTEPDMQQATRILVVTGMSGAGKSSCLRVLEDMGWDVVDNLPLSMLDTLLEQGSEPGDKQDHPIAVGIDTRTRGFDAELLTSHFSGLKQRHGTAASLCFLTAEPDTLQRRFTETRRRHPLAADRTVADGIRLEQQMLGELRGLASHVIDTTDMPLPDLRQVIEERFRPDRKPGLQTFVTSFSYKRGLPRDADLVLDVRFLRNPYYHPDLRHQAGTDEDVQAHIRQDPDWEGFRSRAFDLLRFLTPRYGREGKSYLTIAIGCTGGRHRSVYVAELIGAELAANGHHVTVRHRDLGRS